MYHYIIYIFKKVLTNIKKYNIILDREINKTTDSRKAEREIEMTNEVIKNIIESEKENMRNDIVATYYKRTKGIYVFFAASYRTSWGTTEYAQITGYNFYRIQKPERIVEILRSDNCTAKLAKMQETKPTT